MVPEVVVLAEIDPGREPVPAEPGPEEGAAAGAEIALDDLLVARPDHDHDVQGALDRPGLGRA